MAIMTMRRGKAKVNYGQLVGILDSFLSLIIDNNRKSSEGRRVTSPL